MPPSAGGATGAAHHRVARFRDLPAISTSSRLPPCLELPQSAAVSLDGRAFTLLVPALTRLDRNALARADQDCVRTKALPLEVIKRRPANFLGRTEVVDRKGLLRIGHIGSTVTGYRRTRINNTQQNGFYFAEISVSAKSKLSPLLKFAPRVANHCGTQLLRGSDLPDCQGLVATLNGQTVQHFDSERAIPQLLFRLFVQ
jgi:hypothetical protein